MRKVFYDNPDLKTLGILLSVIWGIMFLFIGFLLFVFGVCNIPITLICMFIFVLWACYLLIYKEFSKKVVLDDKIWIYGGFPGKPKGLAKNTYSVKNYSQLLYVDYCISRDNVKKVKLVEYNQLNRSKLYWLEISALKKNSDKAVLIEFKKPIAYFVTGSKNYKSINKLYFTLKNPEDFVKKVRMK